MKKSIVTFGLFTLMLVLTSFTVSKEDIGGTRQIKTDDYSSNIGGTRQIKTDDYSSNIGGTRQIKTDD